MPELPEVEIISKGLREKIVGKTIADFEVRESKVFSGDEKKLVGCKIKSISRRAKIIIIELDDNISLLIHLKLTGQLVFDPSIKSKTGRVAGGHPSADWVADLPNSHTRAIFKFKDGGVLYFNDLRKFGYIKMYDSSKLKEAPELADLGIEALSDDLTAEYLMGKAKSRQSIKIKQLILDQNVVAGVGNIYADESLFCARISPLRKAREVRRTEFVRLIGCIRQVLRFSIKHGGSSENTFVDVEGKKGGMQNFFKVYRKSGKKCPDCGGEIKRAVVGGRGTHYCPACQK